MIWSHIRWEQIPQLRKNSSGNLVESCGKLEVMVPSSFFPHDVSRCLEFVMQISSKFNSRSISRESTFQAIPLKSTDLLLDLVPELMVVYCSKYDCISKYLLCRNSQIYNLIQVWNKCVKICDKRCDKRLTF